MSLLPLWGPRQVQERAGSLVIIIIMLTTWHHHHHVFEDGNHLHGHDHLITVGQFSYRGPSPHKVQNVHSPTTNMRTWGATDESQCPVVLGD